LNGNILDGDFLEGFNGDLDEDLLGQLDELFEVLSNGDLGGLSSRHSEGIFEGDLLGLFDSDLDKDLVGDLDGLFNRHLGGDFDGLINGDLDVN
jgi:hypothetical protein